jgi:hypothetical protein
MSEDKRPPAEFVLQKEAAGTDQGSKLSKSEPEILPLDLEPGPDDEPAKSALEYWRDDVLVYDDWPEATEAEMVFRLFHLRGIVGRSLDMAAVADSPKGMKASLKNAVAALKGAMVTIRALDRSRHGEKQRIMVDYGKGAGLPPGKSLRDPRYALSDMTVDHAFSELIGGVSRFEDSCRSHAEALSKLPPEELRRGFKRGHFQPDCRSWESQYLGLSAYLAGQVVKLREELERRYTRGQQHIVVKRSGQRRSGVRKIPLVAADPADVPQGAESVFATAQGVKKAKREEPHAVAI